MNAQRICTKSAVSVERRLKFTLYLPKITFYNFICLQKSGAEIGEFLTPMILISYSLKKMDFNKDLQQLKIIKESSGIAHVNE